MGLYNDKGQIKVTIVDGDEYTGVYASDGSFNGVIADSNSQGVYHPCGAFNVSVVTELPDTPLPSRAPNGSVYIVETEDGYVINSDPTEILEESDE